MTTTLEARVEALERSAKRWRRLAVFALLTAAGAAALGLGAPQPAPQPAADLIQAKRLEIVNDVGVPVLTLTQNSAGGIFATQTQTGEILVTITATATGEGVVAVADRSNRRLVELAGKPGEGVGVVNTFSDGGRVAASMLATNGEGVVAVFDAQGNLRESIPAPAKK